MDWHLVNNSNKIILLTGTINTNSCINTKRTNIDDRINDYYLNIGKLLEYSDIEIVFVENSNYPLGILEEYKENKRIEILQFDGNNFDRNLGKGHGERNIINYAILNSRKLANVEYLLKLTGRYSIKYDLIREHIDSEYLLYSKETDINDNWAFTGFFKIPKIEWIENIGNCMISDDPGCYIENVLASKIRSKDIVLIDDIGLSGISGTHNETI